MRNASVAIDGPVASGKSTAARAVARQLGMLYIDTGAMYRALTLSALETGVALSDETALESLLRERPISLDADPQSALGYSVRIAGQDAGSELFGDRVSAAVSVVAAHPGVRRAMVAAQQALAAAQPVVMAGRDIGTVVLPEAVCKVFLTASSTARVARRAAEWEADGKTVDRSALLAQIEERDRLDSTRKASPLRPADGALRIDSSDMSPEEVVSRIVACARARLGAPPA